MYSKCGEGAGLLKRIQDEGNICSIFIEEREYSNVYDGILDKTDYPEKNDIIIFDSSGLGHKADHFKSEGFRVFGASSFHDKLEDDREFGLNFMQDHGIMVPDTYSFSDFNSGIKFIKENKDRRFVFKPSGKNIPSKLTYSCSDTEDLILYMDFVKENFGKEIDDFVLQEFVEGALVSSEYWVGKNGFIKPINHTIEVKKFMNDDVGPSTGCSGNIVWKGEEDSELAFILSNIEESLVEEGYIGPIDLNTIVNEKGIYGLEWTPRFGLDALPTLIPLIDEDISQLISDSFENKKEMNLLDCFSGGVRLTIPPYPIEPENLKEIEKNSPNINIPIRFDESLFCDYYFYEVMMKNDLLVHSAGTGVIACISSLGSDPESCFDEVNEALERCKVSDKQYRTDLNKILPNMYEELQEALEVVKV